ncbi:MAG: phytanoyl-CoA dioxygenase family protein [Planctomycetota bacterium]
MIKRQNFRYVVDDDTPPPPLVRDLLTRGHALAKGTFSADEVAALRADIDDVFERYPPDLRAGRASEANAAMFRYEVFNRSAAAQRALADRRILDAVEPLIGDDCHVIACTAWRNPGDPEHAPRGQEWHTDAGPHVPRRPGTPWPEEIPYPVFAIATHLFLEDCGEKDGPTAVLEGTHRSGLAPPKEREWDLDLEFEGTSPVPILAEAGDVAFFISDTWHRRLPPRPGGTGRYFLQINYGRRDLAQRVRPSEDVNHTTRAARERARTDRERTLIGLHPARFYDG